MSDYKCPKCESSIELDEHDDGYVCSCGHEEIFGNPYIKYDDRED